MTCGPGPRGPGVGHGRSSTTLVSAGDDPRLGDLNRLDRLPDFGQPRAKIKTQILVLRRVLRKLDF
jgi:hypothetical protein